MREALEGMRRGSLGLPSFAEVQRVPLFEVREEVGAMLTKPFVYGKHSTTGDIMVRASLAHKSIGGVLDGSRLVFRVEVWTSLPLAKGRLHPMELDVPAPLTESKYAGWYAEILATYRQYWKDEGVDPDPEWESRLARSLGNAAQQFASLA